MQNFVTIIGTVVVVGGCLFAFAAIAYRLSNTFNDFFKILITNSQKALKGDNLESLPEYISKEFVLINDSFMAIHDKSNKYTSSSYNTLKNISERLASIKEMSANIQSTLANQAQSTSQAYQGTGKATDRLTDTVSGTKDITDRLSSSISLLVDIDRISNQIAESVSGINAIMEEASISFKRGDENMRSLAKDANELVGQVHTVNLALNDMVGIFEKARTDAAETAFLMSNLTQETERIGAAIEATIDGSDAIHMSNERILEVTTSLHSKVNRVDDVLDVVHNLAERTKLLSINASIIASEAGEHGRAFAVVAREVKELAQSTATAIAEISIVLKGLKEGFAQTVKTIQNGQEDVDQGVRSAKNAVVLLRSIPDKVRQAASLSGEISARNAAQASEGSEVRNLVKQMSSTVKQISAMLNEQATKSSQASALFDNVSNISSSVLKSTSEHNRASGKINHNVEILNTDLRLLTDNILLHIQELKDIAKLTENTVSKTNENRQKINELSTLVDDLLGYAEELER